MATQQPPAPEPRAESPPLPAPHTAAAPGPRAARLLALYESSLAATLGRVGWDNFAACYPTAAASAPAALRTVQKAVVERLGTLCRVSPGCCVPESRGRETEWIAGDGR